MSVEPLRNKVTDLFPSSYARRTETNRGKLENLFSIEVEVHAGAVHVAAVRHFETCFSVSSKDTGLFRIERQLILSGRQMLQSCIKTYYIKGSPVARMYLPKIILVFLIAIAE